GWGLLAFVARVTPRELALVPGRDYIGTRKDDSKEEPRCSPPPPPRRATGRCVRELTGVVMEPKHRRPLDWRKVAWAAALALACLALWTAGILAAVAALS